MPVDTERLREQLAERAERDARRLAAAEAREHTEQLFNGLSNAEDRAAFWEQTSALLNLPLRNFIITYGDPRTYAIAASVVDLNGAAEPTEAVAEISLGTWEGLDSQVTFARRVTPYCGRVMTAVKRARWNQILALFIRFAEHRRVDASLRRQGVVNAWLRKYAMRDDTVAFEWRDDFDDERHRLFLHVCEEGGPTVRNGELRFAVGPFREWLFSPRSGFHTTPVTYHSLTEYLRSGGCGGPRMRSVAKRDDGSWYRRRVMFATWPLAEEHEYDDSEGDEVSE